MMRKDNKNIIIHICIYAHKQIYEIRYEACSKVQSSNKNLK